MRIVILLASLIIGAVIAVFVYTMTPKSSTETIVVIPVAPSLKELKDIGELRVMRAEVATLQRVIRSGEPRGPFGILSADKRIFEAVVPVQIELGVSLKDLVYEKSDKGAHVVKVPKVRIVRTITNFQRDHFIIWKDEGYGFETEDLIKVATRQGEDASEVKFSQLHMDTLAQEQADDVLRHIVATLLSVSSKNEVVRPEEVKIEHPN